MADQGTGQLWLPGTVEPLAGEAPLNVGLVDDCQPSLPAGEVNHYQQHHDQHHHL